MVRWLTRGFVPLLLVLTVASCGDEIPSWQPPVELGVCARTPEVRDAIFAQLGLPSCADVDSDDLVAIKRLDLSGRGIVSLQADDFAGLSRLRELRLNGNALRSLPEGFFESLPSLHLLHFHDNPGAPFPLRVGLRFGQREQERLLYLRLPLRLPARVVAHLEGDGVLLASFAAVVEEGNRVSSDIRVAKRPATAGTARVLRAAADRESRDCGGELCWRGIRLVPDVAVSVPALPGAGDPPNGLPTLVLRVDSHSFAVDDVVERGVIAGSGRWRYYEYVQRPADSEFSGTCTVTKYTPVTLDGRWISSSYDRDGRCGLASGSGSSTPAHELPLNRIALDDEADIVSDLRSGSPCGASADLRIVADADSFAKTERIYAVSFDAESRCYYYLSVAQDPNRDEPYRFGDGESCVVESVNRRVSASGCGELVWWGGWGFGGINSVDEARADAALNRPYVHGEEDRKRLATIAACETLPEVSLALDEDSFRESPIHTQSVRDEQGLCELTIRAFAPADALGDGRRCLVLAEFAVAGGYGRVPTRQSGDCERIVHSADWSEVHGHFRNEEEDHALASCVVSLESFSAADWQRLRDEHFCIDDLCSALPSRSQHE